jgi:hypothetical protein
MSRTVRRVVKKARPPRGQVGLDVLKPDPRNPRRRTTRGRDLIIRSLRDFGPARSIVVDESNVVLAGNGVVEGAAEAGITKVRFVEAAGDEIIAVRRRGLTDVQKRALAIADNRTGELAEWNADQVLSMRDAGLDLRPFWTPEEEAELASKAAAGQVLRIAEDAPDPTEEGVAPETQESSEYRQFTCALTTDQERIVRAALRAARAFFNVDTTGNALVAALKAWSETHAR